MGGACSQPIAISDNEDYEIPPHEQYQHRNCTVRTVHQLTFLKVPKSCDYCRIVKKTNVKTQFRCVKCQLNFCFDHKRNHFKWHTARFDSLRGYT